MNNALLSIVVPVLLVTFGFGQTPAPNSNPDQASIKGCLGGSESNYTVAEDGTTQTFRITSSTVDLKPHVGHDIEIIGQTTNLAPSSGPADNTLIVTGVTMISDHCATATASTPVVADPTPATTATSPAVAEPTPTAMASTPAVADTTPTAAASTPAVADPMPTATASSPAVVDPPTAIASAPMTANTTAPETTESMPDTASSLPLLGVAGLGLLAIGLLMRRFRTN
jgi:hypothetical protein